MERNGLRFETFAHKGCKIAAVFFFASFCCCIFSLRFNIFLPPFPSQSPMSKLVRSLELLGKLNAKKLDLTWLDLDLKFFSHKWCKIAAQKKNVFFSFPNFAWLVRFFSVSVLLFASYERCFASRMRYTYLIFCQIKKKSINPQTSCSCMEWCSGDMCQVTGDRWQLTHNR